MLKRFELPSFPSDYFNKDSPDACLYVHLSAQIKIVDKAVLPKLSQGD